MGVAATVLAAAGHDSLAARALGATLRERSDGHDGEDDPSTVRAGLVDLLGADVVSALESDGAALGLPAVAARVRRALATGGG